MISPAVAGVNCFSPHLGSFPRGDCAAVATRLLRATVGSAAIRPPGVVTKLLKEALVNEYAASHWCGMRPPRFARGDCVGLLRRCAPDKDSGQKILGTRTNFKRN